MALRLIEMVLPEQQVKTVQELLKERPVVDVWYDSALRGANPGKNPGIARRATFVSIITSVVLLGMLISIIFLARRY
jgi:hypothetical protein